MKWNSMIAMTIAATVAVSSSAFAVNPQNSRTVQPAFPETFNPSALPGQEYFNSLGNSNDPLFNNGSFLPNTIPGTSPTSIPTPNPYNTDRNRLNTGISPTYIPPNNGNSSSQRWRLGVYSKDTETGVRIEDIVPGLAADRAGLERGDVIVSVNGFQVGFVKGSLYDCATEFERNADSNGWVTLLVQNNRDRTLINLPVQLDSRMSRIQGSLAFQNGQNLPRGAVVVVQLQEQIRPNSTPVTFATKEIRDFNRYPIPFEIDYDPAHVTHQGNYILHASVVSNGREIYRTNQQYPVLRNPNQVNQHVSMSCSPVSNIHQTGSVAYGETAQTAQIVKWFNEYLGRQPSDRELTVWLDAIRQGYPMHQVQLELLAHTQFFNRCNRNKETYIDQVHQLLIGRRPNADEMYYWTQRYDAQNGIRRDLAREFQSAIGVR